MTNQGFKKVLLIDDEYVSNLIMKKYLETFGFSNFITKCNGQEAFEHLSSNSNYVPDVIFLDLRMPIMDGFEFLEAYNNAGLASKDLRIYILTSSINPQDMETAKKFSFISGFIQKPINPESLKKILQKEPANT